MKTKFEPSKERLSQKGYYCRGHEGLAVFKAGGPCNRADALTVRSVRISRVRQKELSFTERSKQGWKNQERESGMKGCRDGILDQRMFYPKAGLFSGGAVSQRGTGTPKVKGWKKERSLTAVWLRSILFRWVCGDKRFS